MSKIQKVAIPFLIFDDFEEIFRQKTTKRHRDNKLTYK
jgi:hypothetical protein